MNQRELIDQLQLDKSSTVHIVDELERQGLAERRRNERDRRSYTIHITPGGEERLKAAQAGAILGFLAEAMLPGHELRRRVSQLTGYTRPVSDGSLYPAINRLTNAGLIERSADPAAGAARYVLSLTAAGRVEMLQRLRKPAEHEITDFTRFYIVLAFLSHLPDAAEQHAVLRRRLEFLEEPASFFYDDERPLRVEEIDDPYRRGMLRTARATSRAERTWLRETLGEEPPAFGTAGTDRDLPAPATPAS